MANERKVPVAALYVDQITDTNASDRLKVLNMVPEDYETGVPQDDLIRLHIVSVTPK